MLTDCLLVPGQRIELYLQDSWSRAVHREIDQRCPTSSSIVSACSSTIPRRLPRYGFGQAPGSLMVCAIVFNVGANSGPCWGVPVGS